MKIYSDYSVNNNRQICATNSTPKYSRIKLTQSPAMDTISFRANPETLTNNFIKFLRNEKTTRFQVQIGDYGKPVAMVRKPGREGYQLTHKIDLTSQSETFGLEHWNSTESRDVNTKLSKEKYAELIKTARKISNNELAKKLLGQSVGKFAETLNKDIKSGIVECAGFGYTLNQHSHVTTSFHFNLTNDASFNGIKEITIREHTPKAENAPIIYALETSPTKTDGISNKILITKGDSGYHQIAKLLKTNREKAL